MPSLHAGWDLLVGIAIFAAATSLLLQVVGCVMPVLMAWRGDRDGQPLRRRRDRGHRAGARRARRRARVSSGADACAAAGSRHDRAGDRAPGGQLAGGPARGEHARRRRHRVRRPRVPRTPGGPAPQDGGPAALPLGPLGAGLGLRAPARACASCSRPTGTARRSCSTSRVGAADAARVGGPARCTTWPATTRCWCAVGYWPSVERVAELPFVAPVLSARNRVELARLRQRVTAAPPVHGVSVHRDPARRSRSSPSCPPRRGRDVAGRSTTSPPWTPRSASASPASSVTSPTCCGSCSPSGAEPAGRRSGRGAAPERPQRQRRHHRGDHDRPDDRADHGVLQGQGGVRGRRPGVAPQLADRLGQARDRVPLGDRAQPRSACPRSARTCWPGR